MVADVRTTGSDGTGTVQHTVISKDGTPIAYWCSGQGRPLVLVHGTSADHTRWRTVLALFEPHVAACAMDRRGRGGSGDAEPYALEREYEDIAAVVDAMAERSDGPVDLFGHSHGALCALEGALLTANVRRLVVYEPPVMYDVEAFPPDFLDRAAALLAEDRRDEVVELFFREVAQATDDDVTRLRSLPAWTARVANAHTIPREERAGLEYSFDAARFAGLTVRTLMLLGTESPEFLRRGTEIAADALADARIAELAGQAHVAMDTAPELLATTVLDFLAD